MVPKTRPAVSDVNALEVDLLSVRLGDVLVLDSLSFTVPRGTSLAIIGPNGAGKAVLFKAPLPEPGPGDVRVHVRARPSTSRRR